MPPTARHLVIDVDLGGTQIGLGLMDPQDRIVARHRMATHPEEEPETTVMRISVAVEVLSRHLPAGASTEMLKEAQTMPEAYRHLVVRVAGYSATDRVPSPRPCCLDATDDVQ